MYYWYLLIVGDCDSSHNENIDQRDSHQPISRMGWDRGVFYGLRGKWVENGLGMIWGPKFRLNISQSVSFFSGAALLKYAAEDLWPSAPKVLLPNFFIFRRQLSKNRNNPKKKQPKQKIQPLFWHKKTLAFSSHFFPIVALLFQARSAGSTASLLQLAATWRKFSRWFQRWYFSW